MTPSDKQFLEDNYHLWEKLKQQGTLKYVDQATAERLHAIARTYEPLYRENTQCPECILRIFNFVFKRYEQQREVVFVAPVVTNQTPRRRK